MKKTIFALTAFAALLTTSCMDGGYGSMDDVTAQTAYGNPELKETNVVTLAQVENTFTEFKNSEYRGCSKAIEQDMQLKLRVTANDIGGSIYNFIACEDMESNDGKSVLIYIYSGGLFSYMPVGQEILVDLKGLSVGTNGYQQAISTPYTTASGNTYPKNMPFSTWMQHFKIIGYNPDAVKPLEFTVDEFKNEVSKNIANLAGRVVTIKGAEITDANGEKKWAPESDLASENDFNVKRTIKGLPSTVFINTSTSAKFANDIMPSGKVDITALVVRYNKDCQLTLRTANDVKPAAN